MEGTLLISLVYFPVLGGAAKLSWLILKKKKSENKILGLVDHEYLHSSVSVFK